MCGQISSTHSGKNVTLAGWVHRRRDHGGIIFIDLRDRSGIMQLVLDPNKLKDAHTLRNEFCIKVTGTIQKRAPEAINEKIPTGHFELPVEELTIFSASKVLPFQLDEATQVDEELRLTYRYLDLRRHVTHDRLKLRSDVVFAIREYLHGQGFYEIETPILSRATPGGAREFLVPSRFNPGTFYGLPQSPQIYKQLLIAGGMERYFQVARCFRDEDLRSNRQPEFTQLDLEMSFVDENDVFKIGEGILATVWKTAFKEELSVPLKRYTYQEAFKRFGSDKPDMRFNLEINDITPLFAGTTLSFLKATLEAGGQVGALCVKGHDFTRSELEHWVNMTIKQYGAKGLLYVRFNDDKTSDSPVSKFLPADFFDQAKKLIPDLTTKDTLFVVAGPYNESWASLGKLRLALGKELKLIDTKKWDMFWVVNFPLFEWSKEGKCWTSAHNPFTSPTADWEGKPFDQVTSRSYDLVINGEETAGGAIRIHDSETQTKIFEILGITRDEANKKFKYLLDAQDFGYPPDAGFAFGIDRLIMLLTGTDSIRDVIAFPKTQSGMCPMMQTPAEVDPQALVDLNIKMLPVKK